MHSESEELPSREDLDLRNDDEDEIMAALRQIRREMLVEFPTDEALFRAMKAHEAEQIRLGKPVVSPSTVPGRRPPQGRMME
jgi:hypothetical protein